MNRRRDIEVFSLSFLDCICCGFGAIILLLVLSKIAEPVIVEKTETDLQELIERGSDALGAVRAAVDAAVAQGAAMTPVHDLRHSSAVLRPAQVLAIGANYAAHASELKLRSETAMTIFSLWPNSLTGHGQTTAWAGDVATQVDYEAELGVIIGTPAKDVSVADALDHVWGYTVVNDITARDIQFSEAQWSRCKSFDGFTPTGPVVVTADEIADPQDLWLTTNLDGHILQDASTNEMVRSVAEIISYLSKTATLPPGWASPTRCPSTSTATGTSAVRFQTTTSFPRGTTSGRAWSECGATKVVAIASIPHMSTGPPFERLYAVDPEGVEQMIPSHGTLPRSSPPTAHSSSIIRPSTPDVTTRSFTAT